MNGKQMAGMMAMGAAGAWCGSVWLATAEAETHEVFRDKMVAASSRDTIRSKHRTGKYSRQLRSGWHTMWEEAGLPALPMPLMMLLSEPVMRNRQGGGQRQSQSARAVLLFRWARRWPRHRSAQRRGRSARFQARICRRV